MQIVLALQAFFAVLYRGVIPVAALPAPKDLPADYLRDLGPSPEQAAAGDSARAALEQERDQARTELTQARAELKAAQERAEAAERQASERAEALGQAEGDAKRAGERAKQAEQQASEAAAQVQALEERVAALTAERDQSKDKLSAARDDGALSILAWLQREGRLIDFLTEDVDDYEDEQIGAAVRAIHKGCRKVLDEALTLERILPGEEEARVTVPVGFDPVAISLSGKVSGDPPFQGTLMHHGWRTGSVKVPVSETVDTKVLAPAEVEL